MKTSVRQHVNRPREGWPYAVRQHIRHTWVLPRQRLKPPIDETEFFPLSPPRVEEVDPALVVLTGKYDVDTHQLRDYLNPEYEGETTRRYIARLRHGEEMDAPTLVLNSKGEEVVGNGSHRSVAALAAGIRRMPVEFYSETGRAAPPAWVERWRKRQELRILKAAARE